MTVSYPISLCFKLPVDIVNTPDITASLLDSGYSNPVAKLSTGRRLQVHAAKEGLDPTSVVMSAIARILEVLPADSSVYEASIEIEGSVVTLKRQFD